MNSRFVVALLACFTVLPGASACKTKHEGEGTPSPSVTPITTRATIVMPSAGPVASAWVPILYRLDGVKPSYLLGTIHVGDRRINAFPSVITKDFTASDELVTEVVMDSADKNKFVLGTVLDGKTLADVLSPAVYAKAKATFTAVHVPSNLYDHMKPWAVAVQISLFDHIADLQSGVDLRLTADARAIKKPISGLETFDEQLDVFDKMSASDQEMMVDEAITQRDNAKKEGRDPIKELLDAYVSGDEERVLASLDTDYDPKNPTDVRLRQRLIYDRNVTMKTRIIARMDGTKSFFFAVGTAHVVGPEGIVALLRAAGVKVERER
ncbi:hypothetical protein BH09MYX1_BH09MYX1_10200 [soil metagenome]